MNCISNLYSIKMIIFVYFINYFEIFLQLLIVSFNFKLIYSEIVIIQNDNMVKIFFIFILCSIHYTT